MFEYHCVNTECVITYMISIQPNAKYYKCYDDILLFRSFNMEFFVQAVFDVTHTKASLRGMIIHQDKREIFGPRPTQIRLRRMYVYILLVLE